MELQHKRIVVTGGAGFIGSHLVDALVQQGNDVIVIDDLSAGHKENLLLSLGKHCELQVADICDRPRMLELFKGADIVFHLATQCLRVSLNDPWLTHDVNATGALSVLDAARENKVQRFVYVSSSEIYGTALTVPMTEDHPKEPLTIYGASKLTGELYTNAYHRTYGLPTVVIRPFNTYGPREHAEGKHAEVIPRFYTLLRKQLPVTVFGDGNQTRDFLFVADTVRGLLAAASSDAFVGDTVNIARGEEVSILAIAEKLAALLKVPLKVRHLAPRPGDVLRHWASAEKAKRMLGFAPQYGIDRGLSEYVAWCKASGIDWDALATSLSDTNW